MRVPDRRRIAASILGAAAAVLSAAGPAQGQAPREDVRRAAPSRQAQPVQESDPRPGVLGRIADGVLQIFAGGRLRAHVNGAYQSSSRQSEIVTAFRAYGEEARVETREEFEGGGHVDVGAALRVWRGLLAGASFTQLRGSGRAAVAGTVPHPIETGRDRTAPAQELSLVHRERATHWFAGWRFPLRESLELELSAGVTYYSLRRGVVTGLTPAETGAGPPFDEVALHVDTGEHTRNGLGFNAGLDVSWMFLPPTRIPQLGVGVFARTSGGGVLLPTGAGTPRRVSAGGLQAGIGLRARF